MNCAYCETDLLESDTIDKYRLLLKWEFLPSKVDIDRAVLAFFDSGKYFCGYECLEKWLEKKKA